MGEYLNKGNERFRIIRSSEFVDKSGFLSLINKTVRTEFSCSCVTRPRRFGKSTTAKMLYAYYDISCDSKSLFQDLEIAKDPSFDTYLNKFPTIYLDVTDFTTKYRQNDIIKIIQKKLVEDLILEYPDIDYRNDDNDLMDTLKTIYNSYKKPFVMIIDEWDAILREYDNSVVEKYLDFLMHLFKGSSSREVLAHMQSSVAGPD